MVSVKEISLIHVAKKKNKCIWGQTTTNSPYFWDWLWKQILH